MIPWNPNPEIKRATALAQLGKGLQNWLDNQQAEDLNLWLSYAEDFLNPCYTRQIMRERWASKMPAVIRMHPPLAACQPEDVLERWIETMEVYYHERRKEAAKLLGRPEFTPFTVEQSVERLLSEPGPFGPI